MLALGNDIVDLSVEPKNGERYFQRLLCYTINADERKHFDHLAHLGDRLASSLIWAIKESTYKSSVKLGNRERFKPKMFKILSLFLEEERVSGCVLFEKYELIISGKVNDHFIHVWSSYSQEAVNVNEAENIEEECTQSLQARKLALKSCGKGAIIEKDLNQIPWIVTPSSANLELSLSHHGRYIACVQQT